MKLRHLKVANFRGIRSLDWFLSSDFICLVGPGDSCKSTVLDAIDLVLSRRWNPVFDDADFFDADVSKEIFVEATIGELPRRMLSDASFGLRLRGFGGDPLSIHDEPEDGDEEVITIRLVVGASLEPAWRVVTDRHPEGVPISVADRERLGVSRLGSVVERDLSWKRGSVLSRLTGDQDEHSGILAEAGRYARSKVDPANLPKMSKAAKKAAELAKRFGVAPRHEFEPAVDPGGVAGAVGLSLHDGGVPVRRAGFGTRRLLALAMQRSVAADGGVVLVDEVEHGLEPYRLRRMLSELLSPSVEKSEGGESGHRDDTVILTTHSPVTLGQLRARQLGIVRCTGGVVTIVQPTEAVQGSLVTHAEAFLSRKVIVCEGPTEMGLVCGLDQYWSRTADPFAAQGVALANGGGAPKIADVAIGFQVLGYMTAVLADSDEPLKKTPQELEQASVTPILWDGEVSTEQRLFLDLPWAAVTRILQVAIEEGVTVREHVATVLRCQLADLKGEPTTWSLFHSEEDLRSAFGRASKSKKNAWFKSHRMGVQVGLIVAEYLSDVPKSDLAKKLQALREWVVAE